MKIHPIGLTKRLIVSKRTLSFLLNKPIIKRVLHQAILSLHAFKSFSCETCFDTDPCMDDLLGANYSESNQLLSAWLRVCTRGRFL